jgi:prepilin-type N-terminal cleavage/methylation domain-containing protein
MTLCARGRSAAGFTLLEVLISIVVLVTATMALLPLFAVGTASHQRGIEHVKASLIARRLSAELQDALSTATPKDVTDQPAPGGDGIYRYDAAWTPLDPADPFRSAFVLKIRVRWSTGSSEQSESFETILHRKPGR